MAQTYSSLDIILVNDGSTDNSLDICNQYAALDGRIRVLSQENKGVSAARNLGLDNVKGEYILFIDSDDYVSSYHVESLYISLEQSKSDMAISKIVAIKNDTEIKNIEKIDSFNYYTLDKMTTLAKSVFNYEFDWGIGAKLYKKSLISDVRFDTNKSIGEDFKFFYLALSNINKICVVLNNSYFYIYRSDSAMNSVTLKDEIGYQQHIQEFYDFLSDNFSDAKWIGDILYLNYYISLGSNRVKVGGYFYIKKIIAGLIFRKDIPIKFKLKIALFFVSEKLYEIVRNIL